MKTLYLLFILSMLPFIGFGQEQAFVKYLKTDRGPLTAEDVIVSGGHAYAVFGIQKTRGLETSLIIKMDANGQLVWSKELGDDVIMRNQRLYLNDDGHILCVGESFDLDFGNTDIFWVEFDPNGNIIEQKAIGSTEYENVYDISYGQNGDVVITGAISDNNGEYDLFVQRVCWLWQVGSHIVVVDVILE